MKRCFFVFFLREFSGWQVEKERKRLFFGAKNQRYFDSIMDTFQIKNLTCVDPKMTVTKSVCALNLLSRCVA